MHKCLFLFMFSHFLHITKCEQWLCYANDNQSDSFSLAAKDWQKLATLQKEFLHIFQRETQEGSRWFSNMSEIPKPKRMNFYGTYILFRYMQTIQEIQLYLYNLSLEPLLVDLFPLDIYVKSPYFSRLW